MKAQETANAIIVRAGETIYRFDRSTGLCQSIQNNGTELLASPIAPTVWRAPTDNDRKIRLDWERIFLDRAHSQCSDCVWETLSTGEVKITARLLLGADGALPVAHMEITYTVDKSGALTVESQSALREDLPMLPRFGFRFAMPKGNELMHYFGMGPCCSYVDKCHAARMGEYSTTVSEHFEHFVRPQENMAHNGTRRLAITNLSGLGLQIAKDNGDFSFNCSHFSPEMLNATRHDSELIPSDLTFVHVDYKNSGIGSSSCGPVVLGKDYRVEDKEISFSFSIRPISTGKNELY